MRTIGPTILEELGREAMGAFREDLDSTSKRRCPMDQKELSWLDPAMTPVLPIIRQVFKQYASTGFVVEFTAGKEWFQHGLYSLHHSGNALDVRTRTLPDG